MNARSYSRLAALLFAIIAVLQFTRAVGGWQISGQRDDLGSIVGKLDCLRGYRWTGDAVKKDGTTWPYATAGRAI